jgi:hypothetical protein
MNEKSTARVLFSFMGAAAPPKVRGLRFAAVGAKRVPPARSAPSPAKKQ